MLFCRSGHQTRERLYLWFQRHVDKQHALSFSLKDLLCESQHGSAHPRPQQSWNQPEWLNTPGWAFTIQVQLLVWKCPWSTLIPCLQSLIAREAPQKTLTTWTKDKKPTAEQEPLLKINAVRVEAHRFSSSCVECLKLYCHLLLWFVQFPWAICKVLWVAFDAKCGGEISLKGRGGGGLDSHFKE